MSYSGWPCSRAHLHRRKHSNSRRRRFRAAPSTPLLSWKFDDAAVAAGSSAAQPSGAAAVSFSSRKLAAGLWQLRFKEISNGGGDALCAGGTSDRLAPQLEPSMPYPNCVMNKTTTKGKRGCSKASDDVYYVFSHQKLLKKKRGTSVSIVSAVQAELVQARTRIRELESKKLSLREKVKHLLAKLEDERSIPRQRREERKKLAAVDGLMDELIREKKSRQRMQILNTRLLNQLANAKLSAEQLVRGFEEEKKSREIVEEICEKLAQQIGEDKAVVERLKREYSKVREELEEERKMLQLAEVWREERVQMKLVDAKLALEDKYSTMNMLMSELETFLRSASGVLDAMELRKAESLLQAAAESLNIRDVMEEFSYVPPDSNDMFSILNELRGFEGNENEVGPCISQSQARHGPEMASSEINGLDNNLLLTYPNCLKDYNSVSEEDAGAADAKCFSEEQGSNPSSLKRFNNGNNVLRNIIECINEDAGQYSPSSETSEVSVSTKILKQNSSSLSKIWRSSDGCDGIYKIVSNEGDRRLSNGTISSVETSSPVKGSGDGETRQRCRRRSRGQWISASLANPHITRGMKGCIEWPRAIQKNVLKAKLSEAIIESQKSQLRHILKSKT